VFTPLSFSRISSSGLVTATRRADSSALELAAH
jgi:hypothetical protein